MTHLSKLAAERSGAFKKDAREEQFLDRMNEALAPLDAEEYQDYPLEHPFFFVIGLPRSGTTFTTQFLAKAFGLSYVNNLAARFYRAPLQGIRLAEATLGTSIEPSFDSNYALTNNLGDIHEFGYFWRHWLYKGDLAAMERLQEDEARIDWAGLRRCLSTLQRHWDNASVFKNIFGSYHLSRLMEALEQKMMVVYIERDELDTAVSIYKAREKYYGAENLEKWWSYTPPEVNGLLDLDVYDQIAGQIHYLKAFYQNELGRLHQKNIIRLSYAELIQNPLSIAIKIKSQVQEAMNYYLNYKEDQLPSTFKQSKYQNEMELKKIFESRLAKFRRSVR
ncbi:MAG: sulfotransferase [Schleiferiaceae bacterium]|nr:sulfotransferase [Schleiferiaceae bacterium]